VRFNDLFTRVAFVLRLAVVTSYFPIRDQPHRGHSAYQTLRQLQRWLEIEVFCPFSAYPSWFMPRNFLYVRPDPGYSPTDMTVHYIEYPALPLLSRPVNGTVSSRYLLPYLKRFKPNAILNYCIYPEGYAAISAAKKLRIPVILGAIGSDVNRIPDRLTGQLTRKALREAALVLTVSQHLRDQVIRLGAASDRTRVVKNGCDSSLFHLSDRTDARVELKLDPNTLLIVFVGSIVPAKGVRELLDAVIHLVPSHPNLQLACIGEGILRDELEKRVVQAGIDRHVRFPGLCNSARVARWIAAANVFCLPSYAEGCPNVVIEALACGRPVVATEVGGIPELVDSESGVLVPPRNPEALAAALRAALVQPWDEAAISRKFRRGWDQVACETYDTCLEAIAAGQNCPSRSAHSWFKSLL